MSWSLAVVIAALAGTGTWLVLHRRLTRILLGIGLLGHAAVLVLLFAGGIGTTPPIGTAAELDAEATTVADPLVQALALTAIVITFAVTAFLVALAARSFALTGDDEVRDDLEDRRVSIAAPSDAPAEGPVDLDRDWEIGDGQDVEGEAENRDRAVEGSASGDGGSGDQP